MTLTNQIVHRLGQLEEYLQFADSHDRAAALIAQLHHRFEISLKAGNIRKVK
jgi:hypothetical protein